MRALLLREAAGALLPALSSSLSCPLRAGTVYSIKMLLEQQCAYVNYTREEDCHRAVQGFNVRVRILTQTLQALLP